jgi:GntR family transcriptional regulator
VFLVWTIDAPLPSPPPATPLGPARVFGRGWRIRADGTGAPPAYAQIADRLAERIAARQLTVGERIPAERELAETLGVSRMTVRQALGTLEQRGLVDRGVGRGTFVARPKVAHGRGQRGRVVGFTEQLERAGLEPGAQVLEVATEPASEMVAGMLELAAGDAVTHVRRLRSGGGAPHTLEEFWVPESLAPGLAAADLGGSLYALLAQLGRAPVTATESLEPVLARRHEAELLVVPPGSPLMRVERVARDAAGVPVEFACDLHRGDRARFVVEVDA